MTAIKYTLRLMSVLLFFNMVTEPVKALAVTGFEPPPGRDAPRGGTVGGGSRPVKRCLKSSTSVELTALSPGRHLGLSRVERPSFSVYLPATTAETAEFSLFDKQMKGIYQVSIPVPKQAGLMSFSLPDNAPALVKDQPYYWSFALACNATDRTEDWVVGGWVEYAQPDDNLLRQLASLSELEKLALYAKRGFWYDAVTSLVEMQRSQPNNSQLAKIQAELLKSGGIEAIATQALR